VVSERGAEARGEDLRVLQTVALFRKTRHRGVRHVGWLFTFAAAVYNLVRMRNALSEVSA